MRRSPWIVIRGAAAMLPLVGAAGLAMGQSSPALINPTGSTSALPEQPGTDSADRTPGADAVDGVVLAPSFESQSAGISFRPPADCHVVDSASSKYIAEWSDPSRDWTLKLGKLELKDQLPLVSGKDNNGKETEGVLERTIKSLRLQLGNCNVLRQDVSNTGDFLPPPDPNKMHPEWRDNVGLIAVRYSLENRVRLSQQAIVRSNDGVYYILTLTSPGRADSGAGDDKEAVAADVFSRMIDSIRLLDRSAIKRDQDVRLLNTRGAVVNWTATRLHDAIFSEQWVRVIKNGKDVGYSYITENQASGIPRPLRRDEMLEGKSDRDLVKPGDGILVGIRSRMMIEGMRSDKTRGPIQVDTSNWYFSSGDRKHEDFSRVVVTNDFKAPKKGYMQEFGVSDKRVRTFYEKPKADPNDTSVIKPDLPPVPIRRDDWELDVSQTSTIGAAEPFMRKLPPWYLTQALSHLLPRLLPLQTPRTYMFAVYVPETREVMMRYVDVLPEQRLVFNGQIVDAIPIQDRLGLEGSVMTHYLTVEGRYLGSENKEQKIVLLPTNQDTLLQIWKDANLTRPNAIDQSDAANAQPGR